jgi:opacity protein-like surface antigen
VTRSVIAAIFCLGVLGSGASAADITITGNASQTVDGSNNYFLSQSPSGPTVRSLSALNLDFLARMPTTVYDLKTNYSYYQYYGPGAADTGLRNGAPLGAAFSVVHTADPLTKYNFGASWQRADITAAQLLESGTSTVNGSSDTYTANAGVTHDFSRTDSVSWSAQTSTVSFSAPNQTPYVDVTTTGSWNHRLSPTTTFINALTLDYNAQDDAAGDRRLFWTATTGLQSQLTKRLSINGTIGMNFINAWQKNGALSAVAAPDPNAAPTGFVPLQPGAGHGWLGNVGLTYQLLKSTQVSLTAAQSTTPTVFGSLQQSQTIGFNLAHNINSMSNLAVSAQFSVNTQSGNSSNLLDGSASSASGGSTSDLFTASATYGYRLTRELRTSLSYTYTQVSGNIGTSGLLKSNAVLVSLTRDFTVLP